MKIKHKLLGLTALAIVSLVIVVAITEVANLKLLKIEKVLVDVKSLEVSLFKLNKLELEFIESKDKSKLAPFNAEYTVFSEDSDKLAVNLASLNLTVPELSRLKHDIDTYQKDFKMMVSDALSSGEIDPKLRHEMETLFLDIEAIFVGTEQALESEIIREQSMISTFITLSLLAVVLLLATFSWFISRSIHRSVHSFTTVMSDIASSKDLSITANLTTKDEIAEMSVSFNNLLASIRTLISDVQVAVEELYSASTQLKEGSANTEQALNQQQAETESVATAIVEMEETIKEVAATTELAAGNARQSYEIATKGLDGISLTKSTIGQLSNDLGAASIEVDSLAKLSEEISTVLDVIIGIAEQTNLLALNAAIEAARAGEQGRGFAVVADEVRTLAGRTQQSTEEISTIIASVQEQTSTVVRTIGACKTKGDDSVIQSEKALERIEAIMSEMQGILDNSTQIATAVEEQSAVSVEVARNVNSIQEFTVANSQAASENAQSADNVASHATDLNRSVSQFTI